MRRPHSLTLLVALILTTTGCTRVLTAQAVPNETLDATRPARTQQTTHPSVSTLRPAGRLPVILPSLVLHLPGVGGELPIDRSFVRGLLTTSYRGVVQIHDWTAGDPGIPALRDVDRHRSEARKIADELAARHGIDPSAKVYITCHSGGAGLAVWALEDLPPTVNVEAIVFLAPALSPTYDLTKALRHVRLHAYVFWSESDNMVLGFGTRMFGTIDGIQTDAAGRIGFTRPSSGDAGQYAKLVSLPYNPQWARYHNYGDHVGGMTKAFAGQIVAPLLFSADLPTTQARSDHTTQPGH